MDRDLSGRTIVITGANAGIGRVTALELARRGARMVLAGRCRDRTEPALDAIRSLGTAPEPAFVAVDLGDLDSVRIAVESVLEAAPAIHVLINNAGIAGNRGRTPSGFEIHFGVNHVGPYLFTRLLLDRVVASAPARIVNVASQAHERAEGIDWSAVRASTGTLTGFPEYAVSKLANVLFDQRLARELEGTGVATASLHPGVVATDLWRRLPGPLRWGIKRFMITEEEGARTSIFCATAPEIADRSGRYWDERQRERSPSAVALDRDLQDELWTRSEAWVGLTPS